MLSLQPPKISGVTIRSNAALPTDRAPAAPDVPARPAPDRDPLDVSYEPVMAGALRRAWAFVSGLSGRNTDVGDEPAGGSAGSVTVRAGDTLSEIARRTLGNGNRWRELYEANRDRVSNPNLIHPGQVLRLPGAIPAPAPTPQPAGRYTVRGGDTLSKIAQRTLGSAGRWREIYELNRDTISNPNIVWPGLSLKLHGGASAPTPAFAPRPPSGKIAWPVSGRLTSPFGMRRHPITGQNKLHTGLDIAASPGTPVKAPASGTVSFAGWNGGYGNYVVIDHGNGLQTAYAHMSAINVRRGQHVTVGTQIGRVGSTGMSTGPHMHFEVKRNGQFVNPQGQLA